MRAMPATDYAPAVVGPDSGEYQPDIESAAHRMVMNHPAVKRMKKGVMTKLARGFRDGSKHASKFKLRTARSGRARNGKGS